MLLAAQAVLARAPETLRCESSATLLLTDDTSLRRLNRTFRNKDRPTNVLSFPQFEPKALKSVIRKRNAGKGRPGSETDANPLYLGDIAMAWQTVRTEAARDGKTAIDHATHLMIHGLLHLYGYDHILAAEAERMEALETAIMKDLGLRNPYLSVSERNADQKRRRAQPAEK